MRWVLSLVFAILIVGCSEPVSFDEAEIVPPGSARIAAYITLAEQGEYRAQLRLGGIFRKSEPVKSAKYFKQASDAGDIDAMYFLGVDYIDGNGVPQSRQDGIKMLEAAANGGSVSSMEMLGGVFTSLCQNSQDKSDGGLAEQYYQNAFLHGSKASAVLLWALYAAGPMADPYKHAVWSGVTHALSSSAQRDTYSLLTVEKNADALIAKAKAETSNWYARFNSKPRVKTFLDLNKVYDNSL